MKQAHLILAVTTIVLVVAAYVYLYGLYKTEGFDGSVPTAAQTSSIPKSVGGATASNPKIALASPKDVQAASDALHAFMLLVSQKDVTATDLNQNTKKKIQNYQVQIPALDNDLKSAYSNPDLTGMTTTKVTKLRAELTSLTKALAAAHVIKGPIKTVPAQNSPHSVKVKPMTQPTLLATPPSKIALTDLVNLRDRINQESLKLANLRSTSPTMIARRNQLESLSGDLTDLTTRIKAGTLSINDIPITKDEALNFLKKLAGTGPLPALHLPAGMSKSAMTPTSIYPQMNEVMPGLQNPQLQQLMQTAQNLKWSLDMNVSYDPEVAQKEKVLKRLEEIENRLVQLATSETPLPSHVSDAIINEFAVLREMMKNRSTETKPVDRFPTNYFAIDTHEGPLKAAHPAGAYATGAVGGAHPAAKPGAHPAAKRGTTPVAKKPAAKKRGTTPVVKKVVAKKPASIKRGTTPKAKKPAPKPIEAFSDYSPEPFYVVNSENNARNYRTLPEVPSLENVFAAQGGGMGPRRRTFPNGEYSSDVYVRPGVAMNDESIMGRGSAAAYSDASVGGSDWQKRSQETCRQIKSAGLGDPKNFGCVNQADVGPDYSWKGNFNMVCNRLGDTWGGWYPAMLGCEANDPTAKFMTSR
jgi:hypothetical protein